MQDTAAKAVAESSLGDSWAGVLLLFVLFAAFFASSLGYGAWLRRRLSWTGGNLERAGDTFLLASLTLYVSAFTLASTHALGLLPGWAFALLFAPGLVPFVPFARELAGAAFTRRRLALLVAGVVFGVRALSAALPAQHGDPLLYHLLGPRLWAEAGGFLMHPELPNALLASTWECLYVWPEVFWRSRSPLYGLVEAQVFAQWLHLFLAWGGGALLTARLFRGRVREAWLPLAGLAALFVAGVQWTAPLAKNDAGIAFWALGAVVLFSEALKEGRAAKAGFSGLFAGLALAGKITALLSLAPLLGLLLLAFVPFVEKKWLLRAAAVWVAGFTLGAIPLYARNYLLSGNPFFPLFPRIFPSPWMSHSWEAHFAQVHPSSPLHSAGRIFSRFPELLRESPWAGTALVLLLIALFGRRRGRALLGQLGEVDSLALVAGGAAAYVIFVVTQAPEIELRYLGASLMILAAAGVCLLLRLAEFLPRLSHRRLAAGVLLAVLLATSRLPLHIVRKIWAGPLGVAYVKTHSAGEAKAWVRSQGGFTVVAGDNETYYLTPTGVTVITERPDLDDIFEKADFATVIRALCERAHARWLLDARPAIGMEARFGAAALAPAKVFSAQGANVYALGKLNPACGAAGQ